MLSSFSFEFPFFLRCCGVGPFCTFRLDALALPVVVEGSAVVRVFLFRVLCESDMVLPRSTNNSMAAGFVSTACTSSSSSSSASVAVTAGTSSSLSDQIASAVATTLGNSLPAIMGAIRDNSAPVSSAPPAVTNVSSSSAMVVVGSQAAPSGTLRLPSFVSTFLPGQAISGSDSACLVDSFPSPVMSTRASGSSGGGLSFVPPLMSPEKALVEISDILTWTEAFTIYQMVLCAAHPHRWPDLTKYKLLIIQTARHSPDRAWLEYDLAFRRDAAATGATDWGKMNLDLYNFHLRSPARSPDKLVVGPSSTSTSTSRGYNSSIPYCTSWNNGLCRWPFGECRFRHSCSSCDGAHAKRGVPCSVASRGLGSPSTPSGPVPVRSFSPLAPVHVVSLCSWPSFKRSCVTTLIRLQLPMFSLVLGRVFALALRRLQFPCVQRRLTCRLPLFTRLS